MGDFKARWKGNEEGHCNGCGVEGVETAKSEDPHGTYTGYASDRPVFFCRICYHSTGRPGDGTTKQLMAQLLHGFAKELRAADRPPPPAGASPDHGRTCAQCYYPITGQFQKIAFHATSNGRPVRYELPPPVTVHPECAKAFRKRFPGILQRAKKRMTE